MIPPPAAHSRQSIADRAMEALKFIQLYMADFDRAPTLKEIATHAQVTPAAARVYVSYLASVGYIVHQPGVIRGIRLKEQYHAK